MDASTDPSIILMELCFGLCMNASTDSCSAHRVTLAKWCMWIAMVVHAMVAHCYDYAHCLYAFLLPMPEATVMSVNAMQATAMNANAITLPMLEATAMSVNAMTPSLWASTAMNANAVKLPISGSVISWLYEPSCRCLYLPCILLAIQAKL